ncbi:NACHT, LRR and PYD domains-containing protein 10 [Portunus trituberculatus]|uniref:NACHT, LRR and PYD domains-containing protein 10 n=1 Tax=Portunus trituberculatus TaxID=210409 RepID=A0A5B7GD37_PORTR|nr:NACHT, LRR and PYD domains-containing protein 10 [Portunus trituberculatus]
MLEVAGEAVLTYTLRCGIQGKCPSVSLDHYLDNLPPTSTANYKKMTHKGQKKYFTSTDQTQLQKDPSCGSFDITLLHKAILIACEHVADVKDPKWTTASDHLEYLVTKVKTLRNEVIHEKPTIHSDLQFQVKIDELKTMVVRILEAARDRYGRCHQEFVQERDKVVGAVLHLSRESIGKEEILQRSANKMLPLFITETNRQLHDSLSHTRYLDPLHFLSGRQDNKVDVHTVFSRIEVVLNTNTTAPADPGGHEVDYLKLLLLTQLGGGGGGYGTCHAARGKPHLLLIEGDAGTGKTTLLTFLLTEWLQEERQRRMEGLHHYDLLVWVVCREHTSPSLDDLLHHMLPEAKVKYGSLLLPFFKQSRVLFLIDGLDERHDSSRRLVADIMNEGRDAHHFSLLCTSRPEEVIDFKATVPRNYAITHVRIVGISPEERMSVVAKHYEWLTGGTAWKHSPLPHCLEEVLWMDLFRLPLNLLFLATMLFYKPDDFNVKIIQSQLYHFINTWSVDKLQDRLATHASLSARKHRQKKIDTVLKVAHQIALQGLLQSRIYLTSEDEDLLHDSCSREGLPRSEFMQAFYVLRRDVFLGQATERYCSPHKGMQDNFAAHHILACLTHHHHSPGDIMRLLMDAVPGHNLHVGPLKNMLCHLLGLLAHEDFASAMSEAVALIAESGVMTTNQWLAVMANTDTNIHILQRVAQHVAQHMIQQVAQRVRLHVAQRVVQYVVQRTWKRNHTTRDDTDELRVTDSTALAATTLLPLIPKRKVQITLGREPAAMDELVKALECHTVEELWLTHQSTHPHTATSHSRHLLRRIPR